jgi:hypothetical protein
MEKNHLGDISIEVKLIQRLKISIFWNMMCSPLKVSQRFGRKYSLHL